MEETLFNKDAALEKAMYLFWEKGYEHTSIKELLETMKILNGSFYNTFGNKQKIFLKVLDLYSEKILQSRIEQFQSKKNFKLGLKYFLNLHLKDFDKKKKHKGCLVINSIQHELLKDDKVHHCVTSKLKILQSFLESEIESAYKNKELERKISAEILSSLIISFIQGISKSASLGVSTSLLNQQVDAFIQML